MNKLSFLSCLFLTLNLFSQENSLILQGQTQFAQMDYIGARRTFTEILENSSLQSSHPQALLWLARTEMSLKNWNQAGVLIEKFLQNYPTHNLAKEVMYEKGRVLFYSEDYENAILTFDLFIKMDPNQEYLSNALFWMGESTYAIGRWEEAQVLYKRVVEFFPTSYKVEASRYRLALIEMKLREEELLRLLRWSHEEMLNALDEFRRRERAYQQAIQAYQRQILNFEKSDLASRVRQLERELQEYRSASNRNFLTDSRPTNQSSNTQNQQPSQPQATTNISVLRALTEIKAQAEELKRFYDEWEAQNGFRR